MVRPEVGLYLNKYVVSIAPFSAPAFTSPSFRKLLFFTHFSRGSADPICPYVRTPMNKTLKCFLKHEKLFERTR